MIAGLTTSMKSVEIGFAEILRLDGIAQHVVGGDDLAVADGRDRSFPGPAPGQAVVLAGEIGPFGTGRLQPFFRPVASFVEDRPVVKVAEGAITLARPLRRAYYPRNGFLKADARYRSESE